MDNGNIIAERYSVYILLLNCVANVEEEWVKAVEVLKIYKSYYNECIYI